MSNAKVIVEFEKGIIQSVSATDEDIEVIVVDRDLEGADEDEIVSQEELDRIKGEHEYYEIDHSYVITDAVLF